MSLFVRNSGDCSGGERRSDGNWAANLDGGFWHEPVQHSEIIQTVGWI